MSLGKNGIENLDVDGQENTRTVDCECYQEVRSINPVIYQCRFRVPVHYFHLILLKDVFDRSM